MALRIFDTETADYRDCTQTDIDELMAVRVAYGRLQTRYQEDRAVLLEEIRTIRSRAGKPNDFAVESDPVTGDL